MKSKHEHKKNRRTEKESSETIISKCPNQQHKTSSRTPSIQCLQRSQRSQPRPQRSSTPGAKAAYIKNWQRKHCHAQTSFIALPMHDKGSLNKTNEHNTNHEALRLRHNSCSAVSAVSERPNAAPPSAHKRLAAAFISDTKAHMCTHTPQRKPRCH